MFEILENIINSKANCDLYNLYDDSSDDKSDIIQAMENLVSELNKSIAILKDLD